MREITGNQVVFVNDATGNSIDVLIEDDTVWLTQAQMGAIFSVGPSTISQHLINIYESGELESEDTLRKIKLSREEAGRMVTREINHYSLDAILSVGYRVSSKRGTRFRQWANGVLRERIQKDIRRRQALEQTGIAEVQTALALARRTLDNHLQVSEETQAIFDVIERYTRSWTLLLQYDEDRLPGEPAAPSQNMVELPYEDAAVAIAQLKAKLQERGEATDLFGRERGEGLQAILGTIEQTFGGDPLYPSVEIRAANLLYFVIKDHPFTDGNKRIGSFLFLHYLERNNLLYHDNGDLRIDDNTLVAMALLIAESAPAQRELIIRLILGLFDPYKIMA
ncbi:MAG: virulence protein RhuM/Fic/DOC family protein [Pseudomonadota bacterium]